MKQLHPMLYLKGIPGLAFLKAVDIIIKLEKESDIHRLEEGVKGSTKVEDIIGCIEEKILK
jgi:hypothetical protein